MGNHSLWHPHLSHRATKKATFPTLTGKAAFYVPYANRVRQGMTKERNYRLLAKRIVYTAKHFCQVLSIGITIIILRLLTLLLKYFFLSYNALFLNQSVFVYRRALHNLSQVCMPPVAARSVSILVLVWGSHPIFRPPVLLSLYPKNHLNT